MLNIPDLYPEEARIDQTAYCLLLIVDQGEKTLWKRRLYREINDWRSSGRCPINVEDSVSLQTVCRRMNDLEEDGYVETRPVFTEDVDGYVEAYSLTESGRTVLDEIHEAIFKQLAVEYVARGLNAEELVLKQGVIQKISSYMTDELPDTSPEQLQQVLSARAETATAGIRVAT